MDNHSLAHIINLFQPSDTSGLKLAQQVTIASMLRAKQECTAASIQLMSANTEDDAAIVPKGFCTTKFLDRDVSDLGSFNGPRPFPILKDILERLYNESDAEYLIFTNVDIGVQPNFYSKVIEFIEAGHDAFIINRRRIPARFSGVNELESMYQETGKKHPGFDCFVFHRDLYPKFSLSEVCTGVPFIGITLAQNLFCFAKKPKVFTEEHLTFHIGMEIFKGRAPKEYLSYNRQQFWLAMSRIWNELDTRKWPNGHWWLPFRMVYWGIHPSLPIRLALKLEPRRWFR